MPALNAPTVVGNEHLESWVVGRGVICATE
jgi:hypothetical protein